MARIFAVQIIFISCILIKSINCTSILKFGMHHPHGISAVDYIYGEDGMYRLLQSEVFYQYNYYEQYATDDHPYNKDALISMADGNTLTTCRDANGHVLLDFNHDGELDVTTSEASGAFYEHNGKGLDSLTKGNPFTNFWFDDNWLARYMSEAYDKPLPYGLSQWDDFTRWQILSGDNSNWTPYEQKYLDTLALDGIYYLTIDDYSSAEANWETMLAISRAFYNDSSLRYEYPGITENYHMALFRLLTEALRTSTLPTEGTDPKAAKDDTLEEDAHLKTPLVRDVSVNELLQHSISLRSNILSLQQRKYSVPVAPSIATTTTKNNNNTSSTDTAIATLNRKTIATGIPTGWLSSIPETSSLMNTESTVLGAIALGCQGRADLVLEAGVEPLIGSGDGGGTRTTSLFTLVSNEVNANFSAGFGSDAGAEPQSDATGGTYILQWDMPTVLPIPVDAASCTQEQDSSEDMCDVTITFVARTLFTLSSESATRTSTTTSLVESRVIQSSNTAMVGGGAPTRASTRDDTSTTLNGPVAFGQVWQARRSPESVRKTLRTGEGVHHIEGAAKHADHDTTVSMHQAVEQQSYVLLGEVPFEPRSRLSVHHASGSSADYGDNTNCSDWMEYSLTVSVPLTGRDDSSLEGSTTTTQAGYNNRMRGSQFGSQPSSVNGTDTGYLSDNKRYAGGKCYVQLQLQVKWVSSVPVELATISLQHSP